MAIKFSYSEAVSNLPKLKRYQQLLDLQYMTLEISQLSTIDVVGIDVEKYMY